MLALFTALWLAAFMLGPSIRAQAATAPVTGSVVNVRSGPGLEYNIVGNVYEKSLVTILDTQAGWAKISYGDLQGWTNHDFLGDEQPSVSAGPIPQIILNGKPVAFEVTPRIVDNRLLVPLRSIFETIGSTIKWDQAVQTATITRHNMAIVLPVNSNQATVNGKLQELEVPAQTVEQRLLIPLRFVAETLGGIVGWETDTNTVYLISPPAMGATPLAAQVVSAKINLRSGPGLAYSIIGSARSGETLPIAEQQNGFYLVSREGAQTWVASWVVEVVWGYNVKWNPDSMN